MLIAALNSHGATSALNAGRWSMTKESIEIIMPEVAFERAVHNKKETNEYAVKTILNREYAEWLEVRRYVRENMWKLKGHMVPVEIAALTDISDPYNCVIFNDMVVRSYQSVFEDIKLVEAQEERLRINHALDDGKCPTCEGVVELNPKAFFLYGFVAGHVCLDCNAKWDYDDQFKKYAAAYAQLKRKGRS